MYQEYKEKLRERHSILEELKQIIHENLSHKESSEEKSPRHNRPKPTPKISKDTFDIENVDKSENFELQTPQKPLEETYRRFNTEVHSLNQNAPKLLVNRIAFDDPPLQKNLSTDELEEIDEEEFFDLNNVSQNN